MLLLTPLAIALVAGTAGAIPTIRSKTREDNSDTVRRRITRSLRDGSIASVLASDTAPFSKLDVAVVMARLDTDVIASDNDPDLYTVFAPDDNAFNALDQEFLFKLLLSPDWFLHMVDTLLYHFTVGAVLSTDLVDGMDITMLNNESVAVSISDDGNVSLVTPYGQTAEVIKADVETFNGVIHEIDSVLFPYWYYNNVVEVLSDKGNFGAPLTALQLTGLGKILQNMTEVTILAPSNAAFAKLPEGTIENLSEEELANILSYHVLDGIIPSFALETGYVSPLNGDRIWVTVDEGDSGEDSGSIMFNDATVVEANLLANNGIIHVIDTVLIPTNDPATTEPVEGCDWWDLACWFEKEDGEDGDWWEDRDDWMGDWWDEEDGDWWDEEDGDFDPFDPDNESDEGGDDNEFDPFNP